MTKLCPTLVSQTYMAEELFCNVQSPAYKLHHMLPGKKKTTVSARPDTPDYALRHNRTYRLVDKSTAMYTWFMPYVLYNLQ